MMTKNDKGDALTKSGVREWLELNSRKGIKVTMVDARDGYNKRLS